MSAFPATMLDNPTRSGTMSPVVEEQGTWTSERVQGLLLELLADLLDEDVDDLRRQLVDKGAAMPIDSLDMFDILKDFRKRTGLTIPKNKLRRDTMRSVKAFAEFAAREAKP
jgi:acyl carrier protein